MIVDKIFALVLSLDARDGILLANRSDLELNRIERKIAVCVCVCV